MSVEYILLLMCGSLLVLLITGLPIAFVLGFLGIVFGYFFWGPHAIFLIPANVWGTMKSFVLLAVPLFVLMASLLQKSGIIEDLYNVMHHWFGPLRGGLTMGTVAICTVAGAMTGIAGAEVVPMGMIALPEMLKRKFSKTLTIGAIMAGGTLGQLIPPSLLMILYGAMTGDSIGKLFAGGITCGLVLSGLYITYIAIRAGINPSLAPPLPREERAAVSWGQRFLMLRGIILPIFVILLVLGSIFAGIATPTEAAACGVAGAFISAVVRRRMNVRTFVDCAWDSLRIGVMCMWIVMGATIFGATFNGIGGYAYISDFITGLEVNRWIVLAIMQLILFLMGCILDPTAIVLICAPIFAPLARDVLGFDPIHYGLIFMINMQMSYLTPPFGYCLYYIKGVAPRGVEMDDIYVAALPFIGLQATGLVLVAAFAPLAIWLPGILMK
ncbi:MAG TPA: TRAP transporter large permease subunit [Dehalococcoidia bacterium]|nr:TRAP transporter large permease subunit [Dehalococcoidia bacterium]